MARILELCRRIADRLRVRVKQVEARDRRLIEQIRDVARLAGQQTAADWTAAGQLLRERIILDSGRISDQVAIRAAAQLYAAAKRTQNITLYDEQLLAGLVMSRGQIAEMQTGEGKTLAAALPAYLAVLAGKKVHVATSNHYLAGRDWEQLEPIFASLGISTRLLPEGSAAGDKRSAYAADIVYGTGYEFGFDYLREQLAMMGERGQTLGIRARQRWRGSESRCSAPVDRRQTQVIVDEIDSVLIDEACLPLLITGGDGRGGDDLDVYASAHSTSLQLVPNRDFVVEKRARTVRLTESGSRRIHELSGEIPPPRLRRPWAVYIEKALYAQQLLHRDVHYVVTGDRIAMVDEYTGRVFQDRIWREGLHQSIAVKEGLLPMAEQDARAQISRQRYFSLYQRLCGMTATAAAAAAEFRNVYGLEIVSVPPRLHSRRKVLPTRYFPDAESKWDAILADVIELRRSGRPVLIASRTIANSERVAHRLQAAGVEFQLLNGKQTADEAAIIAASGRTGAITIATNMAGRGTDIKLAPGVNELGGMHLISVERHETARIDGQLIGRVGRQGNHGSCQFFVSAADPLIEHHVPSLQPQMSAMPRAGATSVALDHSLQKVQGRLEVRHSSDRHRLLAQDRWLDDLRHKLAAH